MKQKITKLISAFRSTSRTDFIKVTLWAGVTTIVKVLSGIVSTKFVAWTVGTSGIALVGNFLNSVNIFSALSTGGIGQGVTKLLAENYDKPERQKEIIGNAVRITLVSTLFFSIGIILFNSVYARFVFQGTQYNSVIILFGISIVLYSYNSLLIYIINGFKQYKTFVRVNATSSVASLLVTVVLVYFWNVYGALLATIASQSLIIGFALYYVRKEHWVSYLFSPSPASRKWIKTLLGFTVMAIVTAICMPVAQLLVRTHLLKEFSGYTAGIWESVNRISAMYLLVLTTAISTYYLPRLSEIRLTDDLRKEIFKTMKILYPALLVICVTIYFCRHFIITTFLSPEFKPAEELFFFQVIGDFFRVASLCVAFLFWAKNLTIPFIITEIFAAICFAVGAHLLTEKYEAEGVVIAYAGTYLLYFIVVNLIFRKLLYRR
ncbi:MAG: O-antigen translocase [Chitinophagaceae bacterium]